MLLRWAHFIHFYFRNGRRISLWIHLEMPEKAIMRFCFVILKSNACNAAKHTQCTHTHNRYDWLPMNVLGECFLNIPLLCVFCIHSLCVCLVFFISHFLYFFSCLKNWMHLNLFFFSFKYSIPIGNDLNERRKKKTMF